MHFSPSVQALRLRHAQCTVIHMLLLLIFNASVEHGLHYKGHLFALLLSWLMTSCWRLQEAAETGQASWLEPLRLLQAKLKEQEYSSTTHIARVR